MADRMDQALSVIDRRWKLMALLIWFAFCCSFVLSYWPDIVLFNLFDTDDNMRIMQVRGLLNGQSWYDVRQYHLNPPLGANIHWSRLVDLPIAGLIVVLGAFTDSSHAERLAVAIAPLLPFMLLLFSLALTARRLIDPKAYPLVFLSLYFCGATTEQFMPERIDHHGWQLALLALSVSAIADPKRARAGLTLGISTALSLAIGLEMIIYLVLCGAAMILFWVDDAEERKRLQAYAVSLGVGTALAFLVFAPNDNWIAVCDALSPVWLSDALIGSALMFALAWVSPPSSKQRLALAAIAAAAVLAFHALAWPRCIQRLEGVSPEAERLWLSHVQEGLPLYRQSWPFISLVLTVPMTGLLGWGILARVHKAESEQLRRVLAAAAPTAAATLLLLWQTRTSPAAQMLSIVGCAALIWFAVPLAWRSKSDVVALAGALILVVVGSGAETPLLLRSLPAELPTQTDLATYRADYDCPSLWGMHDVGLQPKGIVMTFIEIAPRLITVTHHDSVAGPYHRNGQQIIDALNFWRGSEAQAHELAAKYRVNYVLSCPNSSTTRIFMSEAPKGFYAQLEHSQVPAWLVPVELPEQSPFRMWKVVR
jgi:hypothetical protein